ncbi:MAG: hypothetical protein ACKVHP_03955, partial [Verrucomicrobiales bacterium]
KRKLHRVTFPNQTFVHSHIAHALGNKNPFPKIAHHYLAIQIRLHGYQREYFALRVHRQRHLIKIGQLDPTGEFF